MKFLLFNAVAVAAIIYLLSVDDSDKLLRELPSQSQAAWQQKFDRIKERVAKLKENAPEPEPTQLEPPQPDPSEPKTSISAEPIPLNSKIKGQEISSKEGETPTAPAILSPKNTEKKAPPLEADQEVKVLTAKKPPQSAPQSMARFINTAADVTNPPPPKFMTPQQRRRELNRLAHDMEMMFADKLAQ